MLINREITQRIQGRELPLENPEMDALVQYIVYKYELSGYKLSK